MALVTKKELSGTEYEIHADSMGYWSVQLPADEGGRPDVFGAGPTLDKAIASARTAIAQRKVKVRVPFITVTRSSGKPKIKRQVATGINHRTRNVIVQGTKEQFSQHTRAYSDDITDSEIADLLEAMEAIDEWTKVVRDIQEKREITLGTAVKEALEKENRSE